MSEAPAIKFCGITRAEDAELAVSLGAWAIGMILWPGSRRAVSADRAVELAATVGRGAERVGVFVNQTLEEIAAVADAAGLTILQLHGQEGPVFCAEAARRTGCRIIKAARVETGADVHALAPFHTDFHLLDGYVPGVPGGTGATFAWELAADYKRLVPRQRGAAPVPLILSGGLRPGNVGAAIAKVAPYAVDVASGVESEPGVKDHGLMREFAAAVASTADRDAAAVSDVAEATRDVAEATRDVAETTQVPSPQHGGLAGGAAEGSAPASTSLSV